jgi:hypothetical protein
VPTDPCRVAFQYLTVDSDVVEAFSPSTINVRLSAVRKLVGEARRGQEEAASLTDVPNIRKKGTRLGNWLTREQAKELLAVPDRSTLKGKRDYVILALLEDRPRVPSWTLLIRAQTQTTDARHISVRIRRTPTST